MPILIGAARLGVSRLTRPECGVSLYMVTSRQTQHSYAGRFTVTSGVPYWLIDDQQAGLTNVDVGSGVLTFQSGEVARFDHNVFGFAGSKGIQRQVFADPVTFCGPYQ